MVEQTGQSPDPLMTPNLENESNSQQTQTQSTAIPGQQTQQVPQKFAGKSVEEIAGAYEKLESEHGRQAKELGDIRNEVSMLRNWASQASQQMQQRPQAQAVEEDSQEEDAKFLQNPSKMVKKVVTETVLGALGQMQVSEAFNQAEIAKNQAKQQYPEVFKGLNEQEIDRVMYGGVQQKVVAPNVLRNPLGWAMAAWQLQGQKSGFQLNPIPTKPVSPTETEIPTSQRQAGGLPPQTEPTPQGWDEVWSKMGLNKEQIERAKAYASRRNK